MQPATTLPFPRRSRLTSDRVLAALQAALEPKTAEQLAESLGVPASSVSPALARLGRAGQAKSMPGAPDPKTHRRRLVWAVTSGEKAPVPPQEDRLEEALAQLAALRRRVEQLEEWQGKVKEANE